MSATTPKSRMPFLWPRLAGRRWWFALLAAQFLLVNTITAQSPQVTPAGNLTASATEIAAFMQSQEKDPKAMLAIGSNPKRVPLLLGALRRDPAGPWVQHLLVFCFQPDRTTALRAPPQPDPRRIDPDAARAIAQEYRGRACGKNLLQIDLAKQMWKEDNRKPNDATPMVAELAYYLPYRQFPKCPNGGAYTIGKLSQKPRCSVPGHELATPAK